MAGLGAVSRPVCSCAVVVQQLFSCLAVQLCSSAAVQVCSTYVLDEPVVAPNSSLCPRLHVRPAAHVLVLLLVVGREEHRPEENNMRTRIT